MDELDADDIDSYYRVCNTLCNLGVLIAMFTLGLLVHICSSDIVYHRHGLCQNIRGPAYNETQSKKIENPDGLPYPQRIRCPLDSLFHPFTRITMPNAESMGIHSSKMCGIWRTVVPNHRSEPPYRCCSRFPLCPCSLEVEDDPQTSPHHHVLIQR